MVSVCLPSDTLLEHLPFYLGFSYLGCGVSLHSCSSKPQSLLLTLDEGYLLTAAIPDLQHGIAPLGPPVPAQPPLLGLLLLAASPSLGRVWLLPSCRPWPRARGGSSGSSLLASGTRWLLPATPDLGRGVSVSSQPPLASGAGWLLLAAALTLDAGCLHPAATDLGRGVALPCRSCAVAAWHSGPLSLTSDVG